MTSSDDDPPLYRYAFAPDGQVFTVSGDRRFPLCVAGYRDDARLWLAFRTLLPPDLADLADLALAVYLADRLSPRRSQTDVGRWTRRLEVEVPVRDPDHWGDPSLGAMLRTLLWDFTEDEWMIRFVSKGGVLRTSESQPALFATMPKEPVQAALFSGGLDSLAGTCDDLVARSTGSTVLVSAATSSRLASVQGQLVDVLRGTVGDCVIPVGIPLGFRRNGRSYDHDEPSQRSRGFLFLALGAVTALMAGAGSLAVYENGVGAINLPYTGAQRGVQHTRATTPHMLVAMAAFVARATGRLFAIRLPFLFTTKGEMCAGLRSLGVESLAARTVSCDGFPLRIPGITQCGVCTSCLLRRQALHAADLGTVDRLTRYRWDITDASARISDDKRYPLYLMREQVEALDRLVASDDPWRALTRAYPVLLDIARAAPSLGHPAADGETGLVALYRCYCNEWKRFLGHTPRQIEKLAA